MIRPKRNYERKRSSKFGRPFFVECYQIVFAASGMTGRPAIARIGHAISAAIETAVPSHLVVVRDKLPPLAEIGITSGRQADHGGTVSYEFCVIVTNIVSGNT